MKKFLSLVLALVMAFSVATVGFAAAATTITCKNCDKMFETAEAYNAHLDACKAPVNFTCSSCLVRFDSKDAYDKHINGGCLIDFKTCQYCAATVASEYHETHEKNCPKGACVCDTCGKEFENQKAKDAHEECEPKDVAENVGNKLLDTLKGVDWEDLFGKVTGVFKGINFDSIISTIKPIFEKIIAFFTDAFGKLDLGIEL